MLVSVYMPTRNRHDVMAVAVNSVLTQTYADLELLVVDDGSVDSTPDLLAQMAASDRRLRVFRNDSSRGAPYSRNLAISSASGYWITGIDDDDAFHPARLAAFVSYWQTLERAGGGFSCIYSQDVYDHGTHESETRKQGNLQWHDLFEFNVIGNQAFTLTERLRAVGMFDVDMPAWQDLDIFVRLLQKYGPARLLDLPLYTVSLIDRPDRISRQRKERILTAFDRLSAKHPQASRQQIQSLFLQVFGDLYGFRPDAADVRRFMSYGWNRANIRRFAKALLR
jgi:glycosyltransferase involved in cell wall biosynthesis